MNWFMWLILGVAAAGLAWILYEAYMYDKHGH